MLHAVIMAGGSGTRFWPKSRRSRPKQLLQLYGDATMIQQTLARIAPLVPPERVLVITGADQADAIRLQLPEVPPENVVAEPCPRDTAPCVGLAASIINARDPEGTMIVMPADHVIEPAAKFLKTVEAAGSIIDEDPAAFVTFGIKPNRAETGYGYIERGEPLPSRDGIAVHRVKQFREKPDRATAEQFLSSGRFDWNSGIFLWRARAILDALARHKPDMAARLALVAQSLGHPDEPEVLAREFPLMERVPIDKAVMEKADNVHVLEVLYDWNDVGDWRSLSTLLPPDASGNTMQGPVHAVETTNCIIVSDGELDWWRLSGCDDLAIIQSVAARPWWRGRIRARQAEGVGRRSGQGGARRKLL